MKEPIPSIKPDIYAEEIHDKLMDDVKSGKTKLIAVPDRGYSRQIKHFTGFPLMFMKLSKLKMTPDETRVLFFCLAVMRDGCHVACTQSEIAEELGMLQPNVSRAFKGLEEKEAVIIKKEGRYNEYFINPELAWNSKAKEWEMMIGVKDYLKKQTSAAISRVKTPF